MKKYSPFTGQSIFDVSLQHFGSIDHVIDLMKANNIGCTDVLPDVLLIPEIEAKNPRMQAAVAKRNVMPNANVGNHNVRYNGDLTFIPENGADTDIVEGEEFSVYFTYTNVMPFALFFEVDLLVTSYASRNFPILLAAGETLVFSETYTNAPIGTLTATLQRNIITDDSISTVVVPDVVSAYVTNFYNNSITLVANTNAGFNWGSIETIAPADSSLPVATLGIQQSTGTVTVLFTGYAAGFVIKHTNGTVLTKVLLCEGPGFDNKNNITYNVRSGSAAGYGEQPKFFRINNVTLSSFWIYSYRFENPYENGFSTETIISADLVQYGDCENFPRTADGYFLNNVNASLANSRLLISLLSPFTGAYIMGIHSANTVFPIGFYKVSLKWYNATMGVTSSIRTTSVIYGGLSLKSTNEIKFYFADVFSVANVFLSISHFYGTAGSVSFDDIVCFRISHPHQVQVPAHETNIGFDALGYPLTN